ncbi:MAG: DUF5678 domain-containing protein [Planctomycetota bacterium]|nr:DUF5678 domain-containing protein [Planctomycetota bacterium]
MTTKQANAAPELSDDDVAAMLEDLMRAEPLPMVQTSIDAFRRDLPELLETHRGQWVAYHGDERLGFGETETELYRRAFRRGLTRNDFIVGFVVPGAFDPEEEIEVASLHV